MDLFGDYKICSQCGIGKSLGEFNAASKRRNETEKSPYCRVCAKKIKDKRYRDNHPEKQREFYRNKVAKRPEHYNALAAERQRRYRERNPGCSLKGNAERLKRWRKAHPEREASWQAARRTAFKRIPSWGEPGLIEILYIKAKQYKMEVDHVVPLKHPLVCGLHVWQNLQLLKRKENRVKKNTHWPDMP